MDKVKLILKRIISYALVLFGLSILIFVLVRVMPGDTARMALGARASEEAVEALRQEMHLNESYVVQYGYWISGMLSGDFGESVITKRPVIEDIKSYLPATMELVVLAAFFLILFGIVLGVISTKYAGNGKIISYEFYLILELWHLHFYGQFSLCLCSRMFSRYYLRQDE